MTKTMKVRMEIEVTILVETPVLRSGESQVADFVLPALQELQEVSADVQDITYSFTETEI